MSKIFHSVYTRGKGPEGGHAWIVDGYVIQYRKDQNNVYSNQYRTLVHELGMGAWHI